MQIGTCRAKTGKVTNGYLSLCKYKNKYLRIPVFIAKGSNPGKTIFISAGIHGDEVNGIEVLHHFMSTIDPYKLHGIVIFLPVLNPWGFREKSRYIPFDNKDLNRSFNQKGSSISFKIADSLMKKVIEKCDFGIDLHDGRTNILLPHPRIFRNDKSKFLKELSHAFGTDIILEREGDPGMMAVEAFKTNKIPVMTIEVGGAMVIREDFKEQTLQGLKNILIYTNMMMGVLNLPVSQFFLQERQGYLSPTQGILHLDVELGEAVKKGQIVARIHNPIEGKKFEIKSKNHGIVFSVRREAVVDKGESILSILHFKIENKRKALIPIQARMLINKTKQKDIILRPTLLIDDLLSLLGFSYKLVGETLWKSLKKIEGYIRY